MGPVVVEDDEETFFSKPVHPKQESVTPRDHVMFSVNVTLMIAHFVSFDSSLLTV